MKWGEGVAGFAYALHYVTHYSFQNRGILCARCRTTIHFALHDFMAMCLSALVRLLIRRFSAVSTKMWGLSMPCDSVVQSCARRKQRLTEQFCPNCGHLHACRTLEQWLFVKVCQSQEIWLLLLLP